MSVIVAIASVLNLQAERWVGLMELPQQHRAHRRDMRDLAQSANQPCLSVKDGSIPTLKRNSTVLHHQLGRFLSPRQALRLMGWPQTAADLEAAALPDFWQTWPDLMAQMPCIRPMDERAFDGDANSFHSAAVLFAVAIFFIEFRTSMPAMQ